MPFPFSYDTSRRPQGGQSGPFGGKVAMQGQGGFQALPQATTAAVAQPAPNAYGPIRPRPDNAANRIATRQMANKMMLGGRGRY